MIFNRFLKIKKLEVCQASCNIIQIFCEDVTLKCI